MPGFPVPHHLPEFAHIHVHRVGGAIQPSHPLWPSSAFNHSQAYIIRPCENQESEMLMKEKWENIYGNIKCGPKSKTGICLSYADYPENKKGRTKIIIYFSFSL